MKSFAQFLTIPSLDPDEQRRAQLLNILLLSLGAVTVVAITILAIRQALPPAELQLAYLSGTVMALGLFIVAAIKHYWSPRIAAWLFIALVSLAIFVSDTPAQITSGRTLFLLTIPILMASVLLPSYSAFIVAGLIGLWLNVVALQAALDLQLVQAIGFLAVALVAWLSARNLENALQELRALNQGLQSSRTHLEQQAQQLQQTNDKLTVEIAKREQVEAQQSASLHEKEVLLKEIHHRVKNNMQVISSLLDLQADTLQDEQVRDLFRESQHRIKSMALIHEQLYQTPDLARIDFMDYVESLTSHLFRSYRTKASQVTLHLDIASIYLSIETAIPCGLIINELVSNALKHAFPDDQEGDISIELQPREAQDLKLVIRDNGVGLPSDLDFRQSRSLGMTLVMTLVKQIRGVIEWHNDNGLEVQIVFSHPSST